MSALSLPVALSDVASDAPEVAFGRSAAEISPREAALLVASLPNPVTRPARRPGRRMQRLAATYVARAQTAALQPCWEDWQPRRQSATGFGVRHPL